MSTSGVPAAERKLTLRSSDEEEFEVDEAVALQSNLLRGMIEDGRANDVIPLYIVSSTILKKVLEYCSKHDDAIPDDLTSKEELRNFDANFVNVDRNTLFDLNMAADYMEIKSLLDLTTTIQRRRRRRDCIRDCIRGLPGRIRNYISWLKTFLC